MSTATGLSATAWHKGAGFGIILTLVVLHILAIVFYRVRKRQDLIGPMFSGDKLLPGAVPASVGRPHEPRARAGDRRWPARAWWPRS